MQRRIKKSFQRDVGMSVPKTTESRCRDSSVQARHGIQRQHKYPHPYILFIFAPPSNLIAQLRMISGEKLGDGVTCNSMSCLHTATPTLVPVVFGTAIPTFLYIF